VIARIRQLSGLTWEQLAQVCGTSRRTLHLWASGRRMNAANEERLLHILAILQHIDTGSADRNRRRLLEVGHDGVSIVDLIERGLFDRAAEAAGSPSQLTSVAPEAATRTVQAERRPPSPVDLLDAMHDAVHEQPAPRAKPRFRRLRRKN
jgi:transcriptional regulator with XRE-family HTH domain